MTLSQRLKDYLKAHEISSSQQISRWIEQINVLLRQTIEMFYDQQGVLVGDHSLPLIF
jgi:hypothetical protein